MDEHLTGYQAPDLHRSTHTLRFVLLCVIIVALLVVSYLILAMKMPLPGFIGERLAGLSFPKDLNAVTLISDRGVEGSVEYTHNGSAFTPKALGVSLLSATKDASGSAHIVQVTDGAYKVFIDDAVVIQDGHPRIGIARSPSGMRIAFAQALDTSTFVSPADAPILFLDRDRWHVIVYEPSTKTFTTLGKGVTPFFVDETHIAWIAPTGLAMADLVSGETSLLVADIDGRVPALSLVSPDRSLVAWYAAASKDLVLYRVTASGAEPLPSVVLPTPLRSIALGNDAVYLVRSILTGTEILKQPLQGGEAESVVRVPASMRISRLLFGNI
jgi:hypothetical protein